jgi:hypothetical protein
MYSIDYTPLPYSIALCVSASSPPFFKADSVKVRLRLELDTSLTCRFTFHVHEAWMRIALSLDCPQRALWVLVLTFLQRLDIVLDYLVNILLRLNQSVMNGFSHNVVIVRSNLRHAHVDAETGSARLSTFHEHELGIVATFPRLLPAWAPVVRIDAQYASISLTGLALKDRKVISQRYALSRSRRRRLLRQQCLRKIEKH